AERYLLFHISTIPSNHIRKWLYKGLGVHIDKYVVIHFKTEIRSPRNLYLGKGTIIGDNAILDARKGLIIGENVNLSSNVSIYTLQHDHRDPNFGCSTTRKMNVQIDNRVWLGSNVIVLPGVHIGEGAVCCAGCVVTKDVEPFSVVAGIPAKKVGERPNNLTYKFNGKSCRLY
ncbi:MAG: acyltransferase, partial [Prevotella sp.]|nr:acyltransferase [Prevotella sp.]